LKIPPVAPPEPVALTITDLDRQGQGLGRLDGEVIVVAGGLPGDDLLVRLGARAKGLRQGHLERLLSPSPGRRRPPCILADHCGGCSLQAFADEYQQQWKQASVAAALRRLGGLTPPLRPLLAAPAGLGYRNRAVIPLERTAAGHLRAGYYRRGSHRIVNLNHCPVLDPRLDRLIAPLKSDLEASDWPIDRHGAGGLRHLALRLGVNTGEVLLTLISADADLPGLAAYAEDWMGRWPELVGVSLNLQPLPTNLLLGAETRNIAGRGWLEERFGGLSYQIGADTFFQVHTQQAERVLPLLQEALGPATGRLVDAYCGIGTFSLPLAQAGWYVHGIEQHTAAVALARRNAVANCLAARATFEEGLVGERLPERLMGAQALLLDPPRKGLDRRDIGAILADPPALLAYLSCDAATLARDLACLAGADGPYHLDWLQPIDFFPNTSHVEVLAALRRR
jgi:23S rRNA (uracil1939-C5)-methyltransferase